MSSHGVPIGTVVAIDDPTQLADLLRANSWLEQKPCPTCKDGTVEGDRRMIHTLVNGLGADWTLEAALETLQRAERGGWRKNLFGHDLQIVVDGRTIAFDVMNPEWRW